MYDKEKVFYVGKRYPQKGVMTVATRIVPYIEEYEMLPKDYKGKHIVIFAVTYHNPEADRWNKQHGRNKALGMLNSWRFTYKVLFSGDSINDFKVAFNKGYDDEDKIIFKPLAWQKRTLVNVEQTGLDYCEDVTRTRPVQLVPPYCYTITEKGNK